MKTVFSAKPLSLLSIFSYFSLDATSTRKCMAPWVNPEEGIYEY